MPRWIDLYPAWWRARYGDEMEALLADRRPTVADRFDLARGAWDARLHPPTERRRPVDTSRLRITATLALFGAAVWTEAVVLSVLDGWDVGIVYRIAAGFLASSVLCGARGRYIEISVGGVIATSTLVVAEVASSVGMWTFSTLSAFLGVLIVAAMALQVTAWSVGIRGSGLAAVLVWGAVMPVVITAADLYAWRTGSFRDFAWLAASLLWIAAWTLVGLVGLRRTGDIQAPMDGHER